MRNRIILLLVIIMVGLPITKAPWSTSDMDGTCGDQRSDTQMVPMPDVSDAMVEFVASDERFTENLGQVDDGRVRFYTMGDPLSIGLTPDGVLLALRDTSTMGDAMACDPVDPSYGTVQVSMSIEECNDVEPRGVSMSGHASNYFLGDDPDRWIRGARSYREVMYEDIYNGIDLRFHFVDGMFKYDFIVGRDADPDAIRVRYEGIEGLTIDPVAGDLLVHTSAGTLRDMRPVILQDRSGADEGVVGSFALLDNHIVRYGIPGGISRELPMVIDPGLEFSTYLGGTGNDFGTAIAVDGDGNVYVAGYTDSTDFPTNASAPYPEFQGGEDVFIAKFDPTLSDLLFATYVGGSSDERPNDVRLLPGGGLCVAGITDSTDFPVAGAAVNDTPLGDEDAFVLNISLDGSDLHYSSYLGGSRDDEAMAVGTMEDGSVLVYGFTLSSDLPTTVGAYQSEIAGSRDVFVYRLPGDLGQVTFCTYIGGSSSDGLDGAFLTDDGTSYLVGYTRSEDYPVTGGAYCSTRVGDSAGFITALDSTGGGLLHSTLLSGDGGVTVESVALDASGLVYVTGGTNASDFPVTADANRTTVSGISDIFLTVLDGALTKLEYSTLVGGGDMDYEPKLASSSAAGSAVLWGRTLSQDLQTTTDAFDPIYRGESDNFVLVFNGSSHRIDYLTYLGGDQDDHPTDVVSGPDGDLYLVGYTRSSDIPTTRGSYLQAFEPGQYLVTTVSRLAPGPGVRPPGAPSGLRAEVGMDCIVLSWEPTIADGCRVYRYNVYKGTAPDELELVASVNATTSQYVDGQVLSGIRYYYRLTAESTAGEGPPSGVVTARPLGPPTEALNLTLSTGNGTVTLRWEPPLGPGGDDLRYRVLMGETRYDLVAIQSSIVGTSYIIEDAELGVFYYYAVRAYCENGEGPLSEVQRIKALDLASQPREFAVSPGDGKVSLSWNLPASDGGTMLLGFHVWRGTDVGNVTVAATLGPMNLKYVDTDVVNGRTYFYYVTAFTDLGDGTSTSVVDATPFGLPGTVVEMEATPGDGVVALTWAPPDSDGGSAISRYKVYAGEGSAGAIVYLTQIGNVTTFEHTGLTNGVVYYYQVTAVNEAGEGQVSDTVHATPMGLPGPVTDLVAEAVREGVRLTWKLPTDLGGADSVRVWIYGNAPGGPQFNYSVTGATRFLDVNVTPGLTYSYWVRTVTDYGQGTPVGPVEVTAVAPPGPVVNLETSYGDGEVRLTWTAPEDDGGSPVVEYIVKRGIFVTGLMEVGRVAALNYTDTGLDNGKEYLYAVVAVNAVGAGPQSEVVEGTPLGPPGPPGLFKAEVKGKKVVLSWAAPTGSGIAPVTGYLVQRNDGKSGFQDLAEVDATTYTDADVKPGHRYLYTVRALSGVGEGEPTASAEAKVKEPSGSPGFDVTLLVIVIVSVLVLHRMRVIDHRPHE